MLKGRADTQVSIGESDPQAATAIRNASVGAPDGAPTSLGPPGYSRTKMLRSSQISFS